ncbi:MAG: TraR/DksA family transcriptional regulator [Burkholderiales bacterium]
MTPDRAKRIEDVLRGRERVLLEEIAAHRARSIDDRHQEIAAAGGEDADEYGRLFVDLRVVQAGCDLAELQAIDAALDRLVAGDYAVCEDCGHEIELDCIEAHPIATRCIGCEQAYERIFTHTRRARR